MNNNTLTLTTREHTQVEKAPARLIADLDPNAKAKVTRKWRHEPDVVSAKTTRHHVTREPDIFDEVTGEAIWFGEFFAVVIRLERLDDFRSWVACRAMSITNGDFRVDALVTADVGWERVLNAVKA